MSTKTQDSSKTVALVIKIVIGIVVCIWLFKSCDRQQQDRDVEMKGRGMLEARGYSGDLPPSAGRDYYYMREDPGYKEEDYKRFFWQLRAYQTARKELGKKGLSRSDLDKIPEHEMYEAMRSSKREKALDNLAKRYD